MLTEITIPKLTITMEGGTLLRWLKPEGVRVAKDEVLFEIETDKAVAEVPSPADGILRSILIPEGDVQVGTLVGFVGDLGDPIPEAATRSLTAGPVTAKSSLPGPSPSDQRAAASCTIRATPAAKRRAKELGVDITLIKATGPEGRITQEDIEWAVAQFGGKEDTQTPPSDIRQIIAERVSRAWRAIPHIHIASELRVAGLKAALEKARSNLAPDISITDLLLYSVALSLPEFPALNSAWHGYNDRLSTRVQLAFAVQTERGVVAPVIQNADRLTLSEISAERKRLRNAAMSRRLRPADMAGGTFTLTNLGMFPVDFFAPIISYQQSAILATGRIRDRVEIHGEAPQKVPSMWANLAVDHRVADGATAAEFLHEFEKTLVSLEDRIR